VRLLTFSSRNLKEILRDPLTTLFSVGFPLVLLLLMTAIQANIPVQLFALQSLTPGVAVFGLSFLSLFSGMLIAKDRSTSLLMRLYATPLTSSDYILGYTLPLLLIAFVQTAICFGVALCLGLKLQATIPAVFAALFPTAVLFIALGLLIGSLVNEKAASGLASLLINVAAWLSGIWFDLDLIGGLFRDIAGWLPFLHAVEAARGALNGDFSGIGLHLSIVLGYGVIIFFAAIFFFRRKMRRT
jgi:ABC-2 type transport system permease protein